MISLSPLLVPRPLAQHPCTVPARISRGRPEYSFRGAL
jgi:hypothetical protein